MKKKGFTLVELLVVIAIIALLMGILMPALARVRAIAFRMVCGSNLSGIGKAMLIYSNDYEDEFPRAGFRGGSLTLGSAGKISDWTGGPTFDKAIAFADGKVTMTSCLYLLIKFAEVTPKSFICKGDSGTTEFKLSEETGVPANFELIQAWDFGPLTPHSPTKHCSYSYHQPLPLAAGTYNYALTTSSDAGMAVAADRNPWTPLLANWGTFKPAGAPYNGTTEEQKEGNSNAHQDEGQNVLFLDSHVNFEKRSYCAIEDDNIYTYYISTTDLPAKRKGTQPQAGSCAPKDRKDSVLVNNF